MAFTSAWRSPICLVYKNTITPLIPPPSPLPRLPFYSSKSLGAPNMYSLASPSILVHSHIVRSRRTNFPARVISSRSTASSSR